MTPRGRRILWAMIAAGLAARVIVAFATVGVGYDIESFHLVARALHSDPLALYAHVNPAGGARWPYPSGYFPWLLLADWIANHTSLPFHGIVQLPPILADGALAWIVQAYLGDRGATERVRLAGAALVALGPSFAMVSGYEGQLDSVAILPAAAALLVWGRMRPPGRAVGAGLLIGVGAALKTVPALVALALLPRVRSLREGITLLGLTGAVPVLGLLPWLLAKPGATMDALRYTGVPGLGGLSLLAQPNLADYWLRGRNVHLSGLTNALLDARFPITVVVLAGVVAVLLWRRPEPAQAAVVLWLAVFASAVNYGPRYLVWGLPFMLMAGRLREAAALQAIAFPAAVIVVARPYQAEWIVVAYVALMLLLLISFAVWLGLLLWRMPPRVAARAA
jgi:hypothetical protein